jgi:hypothetical protein
LSISREAVINEERTLNVLECGEERISPASQPFRGREWSLTEANLGHRFQSLIVTQPDLAAFEVHAGCLTVSCLPLCDGTP